MSDDLTSVTGENSQPLAFAAYDVADPEGSYHFSAIVSRPYRYPGGQQAVLEIRLLADTVGDVRWVRAAESLIEFPAEWPAVERQDLHAGLWQRVVQTIPEREKEGQGAQG